LKFLQARDIPYTTVPIREQPPTKAELKRMVKIYGGDLRRLFNTSGQDYQRLQLKVKLPKMTADEAITLLANNGNLVKRPFVLAGNGGRAGFNAEEWENLLI
jgi:Spx/MgsR family transcriptional regulator